jgi:subtilisin family serine protease
MSISAKKLVAGVSFLAILFFISNFLVAQNIPGSVYVKLDPGFQSSMSAYRMVSNDQNKILTGNPDIDQLFSQFDVNRMQRVFPYAGKFEKKHQKWGLHLWYKLELSSQELKFTQSFQQALSNYSEIQIAELIREKKINDGANQELIVEHDSKKLFTGNNDFNDPLLQDQWHYHNTGQTGGSTGADIDLFSAWNIQTGDSSVIVAIIDGGVDFNHEDLSANMWLNVEEINGVSGVDDDANGYVDDFHGYNFADNNQVIPGNHGTHVAGTVAAVNNNGVGVAGVAGGNGTGNGVRLMSAQTFGSSLGGFPEAFVYAADNGAVIAQNSWGYTSPGYYETVVLEAIDYFIANAGYDADDNPVGPMQGGLVIFSSGNDNSDNDYYPGYYEPVLSVASTNHNDIKAWYSNYGDWVDVSAPGGETSVQNQGVLSTLPNNTYGFYQGTSMACPHTSGVAALIVSQYPGITPLEVWNRLTFTANNIDSLNSTYYGQLGSGRINAFSSIIIADSIAPYPIEDLSIEQLTFNTARITWTATNNFKNGRPISGYDIRYSTNQINEDNFDNAIRYNFNNIPVDSALTESFELTGLESSSEYYVAIKPISYFGQTSSISNVINFTTSEPPVINVQPLSISDTLFNGDSAVHSLVISNSGPSDLLYSIGNSNQEQFSLPGGKYLAFNPDSPTQKTTKEISLNPLNLSLSDLSNTSILALFNSNVYSAYINDLENRGATVTVKNNLVEQDLVDADVLIFDDDIAILNSAMLTSINNWIREGGLIISQADNSDSYVNAVISGSTLHVIDQSFRSILVNDFTSHPINNDVNQMQWYSYGSRLEVGDNSEILMYDNLNNVVGAATTFELGKIIVLGNEAFSNEHYNLYDTRVFAQQSIDWLINGSSKTWYSSDKQEGVVQQNQSDTISVLLSAKGVVPNTYTTELDIFSNDPDNDQISVDIELLVKGAPDLVLNKENIDFGDVYSNYLYSDTVVLTNEGYDTLIINNFTSSSSGITVRNEIDTLLPKETESIIIDSSFAH